MVPHLVATILKNVRNTLPTIIPYDNSELRKTDRINKEKQISQANKKRNIKEHNLQIGDIVICKQNQTDKLTPAFNPLPYKITLIKGTKVTAERENSVITRNASFFKPYISRSNNYSDPKTVLSQEMHHFLNHTLVVLITILIPILTFTLLIPILTFTL
ncbi:hypothetical protein QE152_g23143 [Popillia japonica]|uniref:Uncharacterized protein n=1 Tax=Popillia japonica TaxID=7064 RepID=A0AAW1KIU3_POPJA